jgi:RimJ/RimL family protein N-acetyltransferase
VAKLTEPAVAAGRLSRRSQPVLELGDCVLRPWAAADAGAVAEAYGEPAIQRWHVRSMTGPEAVAWVAAWPGRWTEETGAGWAIASASAVLGQISLRRLNLADGVGEVSYWVMPAARGRRLAPRALSALTAWAFTDLGLHRMELDHSTLNPASCRVAGRAGYRLEGTRRGAARHADGWHDMHLHARLAGDPAPDRGGSRPG